MMDTKTPSPSDAELKALLPTKQLERGKDPKVQVWLTQGDALAFARAVLVRWGQPQAVEQAIEALRLISQNSTDDPRGQADKAIALLLAAPPPQAVREPHCWCLTCRPMRLDDPHSIRMSLCPTCGNKRCPKANDHRNTCTNSNEPGQPGSAYTGGITKGGQHG